MMYSMCYTKQMTEVVCSFIYMVNMCQIVVHDNMASVRQNNCLLGT